MSRLLARLVFGSYRLAGGPVTPLLKVLLARRLRRGKELPERVEERWGRSALTRPEGSLVWVHAASVGESLAVLPLVEALHRERQDLALMMTSTTVTSARLLAERLPAGVLHQFSPLDVSGAVERFLDHWRPDLAIFVESELWPTQLFALDRRGIPRALVNGRMSSRSYRGWKRWPGLAEALLGGFRVITAESARSAERLAALGRPHPGGPQVIATGSLKDAAAPLPAKEQDLSTLGDALAGRPRWLAASTHPGEEEEVLEAHRALAATLPGLVTLLAPRHPERGDEVARMVRDSGLVLAQRSRGEPLGPATEVYLADTLGEMGLLYRLAPLVFVGGSLVPVGGHNPLEAARLSAALLAGPNRDNVVDSSRRLEEAGALVTVADGAALAAAAAPLLSDPAALAAAGAKAAAVAGENAAVLERNLAVLLPLLPAGDRAPVQGGRLHQDEDRQAGR